MTQFKSHKPRRYAKGKYANRFEGVRLYGILFKEFCANCGYAFGAHCGRKCPKPEFVSDYSPKQRKNN